MRVELNFPQVFEGETKIGYGGDQDWFPQQWQRNAGCASTCGANLAAYYAAEKKPLCQDLYNGSTDLFDKKSYVKHMEGMYTYMKPGMMGYPYPAKFARQFVRYAKERGADFTAEFLCTGISSQESFDFVRKSIDEGHPVALLILYHRAPELKKDNWHWVTITGYETDGDKTAVFLSNCGQRETRDSEMLFEVHTKNIMRMLRFY